MKLRWSAAHVLMGLLGVVVFFGCFHGEFLAGDPCDSTDECGPRLKCVNGVCARGSQNCGNGVLEPGEQCDGGGESATCDDDCTSVECGDGQINEAAGEQCEGANLLETTCEDLNFYDGALSCNAGCSFDDRGCYNEPEVPVLTLSFSQNQRFNFQWEPVLGAKSYQLLERATPGEVLEPLGEEAPGEATAVSFTMPLHFRFEASYVLRACNAVGCTDSAQLNVVGSLAEAVAYVKASNTETFHRFGYSVALSGDGNTLAIGAFGERSGATGIDGDQAANTAPEAGAVYMFTRDQSETWSQQAYVKASNAGKGDFFGTSVALSGDGNTLTVGAPGENSRATGIDGNSRNDSASNAGAVYVFVRDQSGTWSQQAYVKASNADSGDSFGTSVALSGDGNTLAVAAPVEKSHATGINGDQTDNFAPDAGAVYVFVRNPRGTWLQQAYVKASNTDIGDLFGYSVALSDNGNTLAVGAPGEKSSATDIGGNQGNDSTADAGAVYVFVRDPRDTWSQQAYVKAFNTDMGDLFGYGVALSSDGNTLAVGTPEESSHATDIGGDQGNDSTAEAGAVYVFVRDPRGTWSQQAYVKASNTDAGDSFGYSVALSGDGNTLAVGATWEDSSATGINGNQTDNSALDAGAVYMFVRDPMGTWSQHAYVKASNAEYGDVFGTSVALSADGHTLAVGAPNEDGSATGIGANLDDQSDDDEGNAGAVYLY